MNPMMFGGAMVVVRLVWYGFLGWFLVFFYVNGGEWWWVLVFCWVYGGGSWWFVVCVCVCVFKVALVDVSLCR